MELLLVSHKYPPSTGGMEKQSFELIKGLGSLTKIHTIVYEGTESRLLFFFKLQSRINKVLRANHSIALIHFNDGLIAAVSLLHAGYKHVKRSATFHGLDVVFPSRIYQRFIFPKFNNFDLLFAVSNATAAACIARGIAVEKIVVVKNGVDTVPATPVKRTIVDATLSSKYNINLQGKRLLVAIGRPVKRKGFSWFIIQVMPLLKEDVMLLLIGPVQQKRSFLTLLPSYLSNKMELFLGTPSDEAALHKLMQDPEVSQRVIRTGKIPRQEINQLLGVADAFIMPNINVPGDMEGFGLVCLEACMQGAKVFAAASGGITDAITDQKNGRLLTSGDKNEWATALNNSLSGYEPWQLTPEEVIQFTAANFSWKKMSEEYYAHFSNLLKS